MEKETTGTFVLYYDNDRKGWMTGYDDGRDTKCAPQFHVRKIRNAFPLCALAKDSAVEISKDNSVFQSVIKSVKGYAESLSSDILYPIDKDQLATLEAECGRIEKELEAKRLDKQFGARSKWSE